MRGRRLWIGAAVLAILGAGAWAARDTYATARIGTVYVAKQTCSCLFVAGRSSDSCMTDYNRDDMARLNIESGASGVTVSALGGLVSARAEFNEGYGCHPVD